MNITCQLRMIIHADSLRFQEPGHEARIEEEALSQADHEISHQYKLQAFLKQLDFMVSSTAHPFEDRRLVCSNREVFYDSNWKRNSHRPTTRHLRAPPPPPSSPPLSGVCWLFLMEVACRESTSFALGAVVGWLDVTTAAELNCLASGKLVPPPPMGKGGRRRRENRSH